jgi:hypothetical protein
MEHTLVLGYYQNYNSHAHLRSYCYLPPHALCNDKILISSTKSAFASSRSIADIPESTQFRSFELISWNIIAAGRQPPQLRSFELISWEI